MTFSYAVKSRDVGCWDWLDIYVVTPTDSVGVVKQFAPVVCVDYPVTVQLRSTATIPGVIDLEPWQGQHVQVVFSVTQDGYVDQTAAFLTGIKAGDCSISPLKPLTGAKALQLEGDPVDEALLTTAMQQALSCFRNCIGEPSLPLTSAYRDEEYQAHLLEVWQKHLRLKPSDRDPSSPCKAIADSIDAHWLRHGIDAQPAPATGPHTRGIAVDIPKAKVTQYRSVIDSFANRCCLYRPQAVKDSVHIQLKGGTCVQNPCP